MEGHETRDILQSIGESGDRMERSIGILSNELRDTSTAVTKGFARGGQDDSRSDWPILFSVMFGLMAPLYIFVYGISDSLSEHRLLEGHPAAATQLAAFEVSLMEIETQFRGVGERITLEHKHQDGEIDYLMEWKKQLLRDGTPTERALWERIQFLEYHVLKRALPNLHGVQPRAGP